MTTTGDARITAMVEGRRADTVRRSRRAIEALNAVNEEITSRIHRAWGRK